QTHVSLLPVGTIAGKLSPAAFFSRIGGGADGEHLHFENRLHRLPDLGLGRSWRHLEDQRVLVFLDGQAFFRDHGTANDLICGFHQATSAAFSWRVRRRGEPLAFFAPSPAVSFSLRWRLEVEFFNETCKASMAGCEKIARS